MGEVPLYQDHSSRFIAVRGAWEVRAFLTKCICFLVFEYHSIKKRQLGILISDSKQ